MSPPLEGSHVVALWIWWSDHRWAHWDIPGPCVVHQWAESPSSTTALTNFCLTSHWAFRGLKRHWHRLLSASVWGPWDRGHWFSWEGPWPFFLGWMRVFWPPYWQVVPHLDMKASLDFSQTYWFSLCYLLSLCPCDVISMSLWCSRCCFIPFLVFTSELKYVTE